MSIKDYGIDKLSTADQLLLAQEIWTTLALIRCLTVPDWQMQEIERRWRVTMPTLRRMVEAGGSEGADSSQVMSSCTYH